MENVIEKVIFFLGIYCLAITIIGTFGNLFNFFIILKTKLKKTTSFVFFCFLAITDTVSLYFWNLDHFLWPFFNSDRQNESVVWCRFDMFIQFVALQSSAFFIVLISFDRYLSVKFTNWSKLYFKPKQTIIVSIALIGILVGLNLNMLFTYGFDQIVNGTRVIQCYYTDLEPSTKWMDIWGTIYSILYSLIPFIMLLISSSLLIYEINNRSRNIATSQQRQENQKSLSKTVVLFALLFMIMTAPGAIVTSFLNSFLQSSGQLGLMVITLCDCITFSFHALNFLILYCTNKRFSREAKSYFRNKRKESRSKAYITHSASRTIPNDKSSYRN